MSCPLQTNFEEGREIARIKNPPIETNVKAEPNTKGEQPIAPRELESLPEGKTPSFNGA